MVTSIIEFTILKAERVEADVNKVEREGDAQKVLHEQVFLDF